MSLEAAIKIILVNLCSDDCECFFDCDDCQEAQSVLRGYIDSKEAERRI